MRSMNSRVRALASFPLALLALVLTAATVRVSSAQSLGDIAKREEARRQAIKDAGKVYTNKDLVPAPPSSGATAKPAAGAVVPASADAEQAADKGEDKGKGDDQEPKDQAAWAARMKELQTQLDRDQIFADALQSRINALTAEFTSRDDPAQRARVGADKQKALSELDRLKLAIQNDKKAVADLEEAARKAGIPPGWLRP